MTWIGLEIGVERIIGAVLDGGHVPLGTARVETPRGGHPHAVIQAALGVARPLARRYGPVTAMGVAFPGLVDDANNGIDSAAVMPEFAGVRLASRLSDELALPCIVENDAICVGFGEYAVLGKPAGLDMIALTVNTGIGGAIILDGRFHRGRAYAAGEFGKTTIDWQGGDGTEHRGSLNALASGAAISRSAWEHLAASKDSLLRGHVTPPSVEEVARVAEKGDELATQVIVDAARALGVGVANFINILNPDRVVLSGTVAGLGQAYLDTVIAEAQRRTFRRTFRDCEIAVSKLGEKAAALRAARLACDEAIQQRPAGTRDASVAG